MDDAAIVALFWARDERAIPTAAEKYGAYCAGIAGSILPDRRDAEECVSDTYLRAWSAMPPHRPAMLAVFLGRITRNLALNRLRSAAAQKRGGGGAEAVFEELQHIVSDRDTPEIALDRRELVAAINDFSPPSRTPSAAFLSAATGILTAWPTSPSVSPSRKIMSMSLSTACARSCAGAFRKGALCYEKRRFFPGPGRHPG